MLKLKMDISIYMDIFTIKNKWWLSKKNYSENRHINLSVDSTDFKSVSLDKINEMRSKNNEIKRWIFEITKGNVIWNVP